MEEVQVECPGCEQKSSCFRQLGKEELQFADRGKVQIYYKKAETIVKQGSFITHVLYVKEGLVKVYKEHPDGSNLIYNILPEGSLVGLSNLHTHGVFKFSVAALTNSVICSIDKGVLEQLAGENRAFANSVVKSISKESHHLREKMTSLSYKPIRGRLSDSLLYLAGEVFHSEQFPNKLSRNDLAEFSGMAMMSVVRTIQDFIKKGYLEECEGRIKLLDVGSLEKVSNGSEK